MPFKQKILKEIAIVLNSFTTYYVYHVVIEGKELKVISRNEEWNYEYTVDFIDYVPIITLSDIVNKYVIYPKDKDWDIYSLDAEYYNDKN